MSAPSTPSFEFLSFETLTDEYVALVEVSAGISSFSGIGLELKLGPRLLVVRAQLQHFVESRKLPGDVCVCVCICVCVRVRADLQAFSGLSFESMCGVSLSFSPAFEGANMLPGLPSKTCRVWSVAPPCIG